MRLIVNSFWKVWRFWFALPDKVRFVLVGGFNATVQYALDVLILLIWGESIYQTALVASWILSTFSSFATQKVFVFCTKGNLSVWIREYIKCLGVWVVSYGINAGLLGLFVQICGINAYAAQILAIACTTVSSYLLFKYFAFKH